MDQETEDQAVRLEMERVVRQWEEEDREGEAEEDEEEKERGCHQHGDRCDEGCKGPSCLANGISTHKNGNEG